MATQWVQKDGAIAKGRFDEIKGLARHLSAEHL
jgi:hypothetical protein